jgi:hypothetical protein
MDPEILRRKAAANGNGIAANGNGHTVLAAAVRAGAVKTSDGLVANGNTGTPAVNGTNKIVGGVAA